MVGTAWRLKYIDSSGTKQVIAEKGQDTGAAKIDHMRYILKRKNPWILKVFCDPSVLNSIPQEVTSFQADEPEILFEEYDGSWTTRGRFYNASETNEENEYAILFTDFYHKIMNQEASVSSTTTHIVDVLEKALPNGYVVDAPAEVDVTGGYPEVDNYSANNAQIRKVYREITRDNNWSLFFLPEQDGSNNWKVRFEPDGFGGTVDTLDTSTDNDLKIKTWQPPRKRNLITKTYVEGVNSSGTKITSTAENTTIRDKYLGTKAGDHNFEKFKVGYLESQAEADRIAENRLVPGPDATDVNDKVKISTTIYPQDVVNDSFGLIDQFRGIDDTFTCVKQENFYPGNQSYLHFEFESEELEKAAEGEENLRDERARLYPSSTTDVGNQNVTTGDALSNTAKTGGVGDSNDRNDDLSNVAKVGGVGDSDDRGNDLSNVARIGTLDAVVNGSLSGSSDSLFQSEAINSSAWDFFGSVSASTDAVGHLFIIQVLDISSTTNLEFCITDSAAPLWQHQAYQVGANAADGISEVGSSENQYMEETYLVSMTGYAGGNTLTYNVYVASSGSGTPTVDLQVDVIELNHKHPESIDVDNNAMGLTDDVDTDNQSMGLTDDIDTDDNLHGGGSGDDQHGGSTDTKNINVATEDKTDR